MVVGVRSWELLLPGAQSLKDKRAVLQSLKHRLHDRFNVAVAETGAHDLWQRAEVTVCTVSTARAHVEAVLQQVDRAVEEHAGVRILDTQTSFR